MLVIPKVRHVAAAAACLALAASVAAQTVRVNVGLGGAEPDGVNTGGRISGDGRFVVFASQATNLVAGDTNGSTDVFVRDLVGASTTRVSLAEDGLERSGASGLLSTAGLGGFDISDDGRYVVFASHAALVAGDIGTCVVPPATTPVNCPDIYLRDRQLNQTVRISVGVGGAQPNGLSHQPQISGDGRWVVFVSEASNLVANDTNGVGDVFLLDRQTSSLTRVSQSTSGAQADLPSGRPAISDDGGVIAFISASALLSSEPDTVACERAPPACERPFMVDRVGGTTRRVPMPAIVTSRTVELPDRPLTITYRATASWVGVAPDGSSVFVSVNTTASVITITTGLSSENWIYDRTLDRITHGFTGSDIASWDGRRYTHGDYPRSSVIFGQIGVADTVTSLDDIVVTGSATALPRAGNLSADGRYFVYAIEDTTLGRSDIFVRDLDPDADGMPSYWETYFGLDPAVPTDAAADPDADGTTSLAEFERGSHPLGTEVRYLAEGATNGFFRTTIAIANPAATAVPVVVRYQGDNGTRSSVALQVHARGRRSLEAGLAGAASFSTVVESSLPVVVDRTMTWGGGYGSHAETAIAEPATAWFLAEGATHGAFTLFYLLQNPGAAPATVDVTYLRPSPAAPVTRQYTIAAASRLTIAVDAITELTATDVSASIASSVPILVERAMYMDTATPPQVFGAGHAGAGVTATNTRWFLAEGATGSFFDLYYLIANPSTQATTARVTYLRPAGAPIVKEYQVAAQSRLTISVDGEDPLLADTPVSAIIESTSSVGLVVERSMWWPGQGQWQEGHLAAGSTVAARRWALAAGGVGSGVETYVLIANTSATAGTATLTTLPVWPGTPFLTTTVPIPANSRVSVPMSQFPVLNQFDGTSFGTLVESDGPDIVVERAMYTDFNGIVWAAGTAALGTPLP
jgi:hypothetical protein